MVSQGPPSPARQARRAQLMEAARALVGHAVNGTFDPVRSALCPVDVVMVAGSPWLKDGLERDFARDESGYLKLGGGSNTPRQNYFYRSTANLIHYLKRSGFYVPRGGHPPPVPGMVCFFDWDDRGRYNFAPDRSGIVLDVRMGRVTRAVLAEHDDGGEGYVVRATVIKKGSDIDRALIGYADLP